MAGTLSGKVALVTGASSGIGEGTAEALAAAGAHVVVVARRVDRLKGVVDKITAAGGKALALPADITDEASAKGVIEETVKRLGRIDILVNNAGINQVGTIANADLGEWRRVMDINFMAAVYTCVAAVPHMQKQGGGDIVNISSMAARKTSPIFNSYSASKHALNAMSDGMRQELGTQNIRITIIEPGATTSEVAEGISDPKLRDMIHKHVHKDGAMKPEDVAAAILLAVSLPRRAAITQLSIRPTIDVTP